MATKKTAKPAARKGAKDALDQFTDNLVGDLNKSFKTRIAYNLSAGTAPTEVSTWISTGSTQLDYDIANKPNGGLPVGRIVEISGQPSLGKSHIAAQICKSAQEMGGVAIMIDAENATSPENLQALGVNIDRRFVYVDTSCTEEIFEVVEKSMVAARAAISDIPLVIVWDSIAGSSPRDEIEGEYDKNTVGLQARVLSKGFRKITRQIGVNKALLVCINQMRMKIGVGPYGDPWCVNPYTTDIKFRFIDEEHAAKASTPEFTYNAGSTYTRSLDFIARMADEVLELDIASSYREDGALPEQYSQDAISVEGENTEMDDPDYPLENVNISELGIEVESPDGFTPVLAFLVKKPVKEYYYIEGLNFAAAGNHRVKLSSDASEWTRMKDVHGAVRVDRPMPVVDLTVAGSEYVAHGLIHHNTTPGGNALPYHASVRIRLTGGKQIKNKEDDPIGINVISRVIKNKVAVPFRKSNFEIHFGVGIIEHEQLFDVLREAGDRIVSSGETVGVHGTGAWKTLMVVDGKGEVVLEKKFYKAGFAEVITDPETKPWIDKLCEQALVKKMGTARGELGDGESPETDE